MKTTTIDILRHGEVQGGARYRGRTDDPLTPTGWDQMRRQTDAWQGDSVISSPMSRCQAFAARFSSEKNIPLYVDPTWREIDFGDWEGKTANQIIAHTPNALKQYYTDPVAFAPPNGENHAEFSRRVASGWHQLLEAHCGQHVLVITHAGVIRSLFSLIFDLSFRRGLHIEIGHACLSRFKCYHDDNDPFIQLSFHKPI